MSPAFQSPLRWLRRIVLALCAGGLAVTALNLWMVARSSGRIYRDAASVPQTDCALVLGTGKYVNGRINSHFRLRMDAAAALYKAGRVRHLLLSGDNGSDHYNEPRDMRDALVERGVPVTAMTCDFAGFRTLDSVARAKEIFGLSRCVIVSDDFHLARALWLAERAGIEATAYYDESLTWRRSWKSRGREWLARVKAVSDDLTGTRPKFGGEKIPLPLAQNTAPPARDDVAR
jgi:SanA protein